MCCYSAGAARYFLGEDRCTSGRAVSRKLPNTPQACWSIWCVKPDHRIYAECVPKPRNDSVAVQVRAGSRAVCKAIPLSLKLSVRSHPAGHIGSVSGSPAEPPGSSSAISGPSVQHTRTATPPSSTDLMRPRQAYELRERLT